MKKSLFVKLMALPFWGVGTFFILFDKWLFAHGVSLLVDLLGAFIPLTIYFIFVTLSEEIANKLK